MGSAVSAVGDAGPAEQAALQGFNYGTSSPLNGSLASNGASASNILSSLLGNTPNNPTSNAAAASGFQNYLGMSGFPTALAQSQMGVVNQSAANGTYNSGGTIRATAQNAATTAAPYATNYANYLSGVANQGQSGINSVTAAGTGGGAAAANAGEQAANAAGQATASSINGIGSLLGAFL